MSTATESKPSKRVVGILAEYAKPGDVLHAAEKVRDAGYSKWDVNTPYPVHGLDAAMGLKPTPMGWIALMGGLTGGSFATWMQWWMNGVDYPINIAGKPPFAIQTSIPIMFELTVLLTAFANLFGMLALNRLPQFYHWAFASRRFERVTDDRFFVTIEADDDKFDLEKTRALLEKTHPLGIELVEESAAGKSAAMENVHMTVEALTGITSPFKKEEN